MYPLYQWCLWTLEYGVSRLRGHPEEQALRAVSRMLDGRARGRLLLQCRQCRRRGWDSVPYMHWQLSLRLRGPLADALRMAGRKEMF
jgi:hypothetical protein